ncbi:MAG: papain-like cysteine protease family protein [Minicystis sp.]
MAGTAPRPRSTGSSRRYSSENPPQDIFHRLLREPDLKNFILFTAKWAWTPWQEGNDVFEPVPRPTTVKDWVRRLKEYGPIVVSISLLGPAGHFLLVVGADVHRGLLYYRDPLSPKNTILEYPFEKAMTDFKGGIYAVDLIKLDAKLKALK